MIVKEGEFKGHPTLSFLRSEDDKWGITLGVKKIQAVLDNLEVCKEFVAKHTEPKKSLF